MDGTPDSDHTANGPTTNTFVAAETLAIGELVYFNSSGKWAKTDADAEATARGLLGIALEAKNLDEAVNVALPGSFVRDDSWNWTVGGILYIGLAAGTMIQEDDLDSSSSPFATGDVIRVVGWAVSADIIYFYPSEDYITHA